MNSKETSGPAFHRALPDLVRAWGPKPRFVCVGHALKETLGTETARKCLESGVISGGGEVAGSLCISDGGDGFLEAYRQVRNAVEVRRECTAPLGNRIEAEYLWDEEERTAVIEIARCSGLSLVPPEARDVMHSGTAGVGDLLADALDRGARKVLMGLGGSATSDCAIGMLMRLEELLAPPRRAGLSRCAADLAGMDAPDARRLRETFAGIELTGCTDVRNPLCGPAGCAARFAPQKGADPEQVAWLDAHIGNWAGGIEQQLEKCLREIPGAGAAGGLGFGVAVLGGQLVPGARLFLELAGFDRKLADADAVVTSEGRFDSTSFDGKAPWQVACTAREAGRRAIIVCGSADAHAAETARREGVDIITFGEGIPVQLRAAASPGLISKAIAAFLLSR